MYTLEGGNRQYDFQPRHFIKEQLPRTWRTNTDLDVRIEKVRKAAGGVWGPEIEVEFGP